MNNLSSVDPRLLKEISPNRFRLTQGENHPIFRAFGFFFFLPGLFVTAIALGLVPMDEPVPPLWGVGSIILLMGIAFSLAGLWIMLRRLTIEIDMRTREIVMTRAPFPWSKTEQRLPFTGIAALEIQSDQDGSTTWYRTVARAHTAQPMVLFSSLKLINSTQLCEALAQKTGLPVIDMTMGSPLSLTAENLTIGQEKEKETSPSFEGVRFREIPSTDASVKLLHGEHRGSTVYKAIYPKAYIAKLLVCAIALFINYQFTGFKYDELYEEMQEPDKVIFYAAFFFFLTLLTIIMPWYGLIKECLKKNRFAELQLRSDTLSVFEMGVHDHNAHRFKIEVELNRSDLIAISAQTAAAGTWKIAKWSNCLQLRTRSELLSCFHGMNADHLEIVRDAVKKFLKQD